MTSFMGNTGGIGMSDLLKEGSKHMSGVEEAVMKNIEACKKLGISKDKIRLLPLGSISMDSISLDNFYQVCGPIWRAGGHVASHAVSCRRSRSCVEPTCVASSVH